MSEKVKAQVKRMIRHYGTQQALADVAGVNQSSVSHWITGLTKPSLASLMRIERDSGGVFKAYQIRPELF